MTPEFWDACIKWRPSALSPAFSLQKYEEYSSIKRIITPVTPINHPAGTLCTTRPEIRVAIVRIIWIVNISGQRYVTRLLIEESYSSEFEAIIVKDIEVGKHTCRELHHPNLKVCKTDEFASDQMVPLSITWHPVHDIKLSILIGQ